jgi:hypothetical protein
MHGCKKCMKMGGIFFLVFGLLFLLRDINIWDFWNIQWWTVLFVLMGVMKLGMSKCPDCNAKKK